MTTDHAFGQTDVGRLGRVLVKHARDAFRTQEAIDRQWRGLNYLDRPDLGRAIEESDGLVATLEAAGATPVPIPPDDAVGLDSIYPRDAAVVCDDGVILCRPAKAARAAEPEALERFLGAVGIPVAGRIVGDGRLEGGDVVWLDERTLMVGIGPRTNAAGARQLRALLDDRIDELITIALPDHDAPGDVWHLMSFFSPIDRDLALVDPRHAPPPFLDLLRSRGISLVEVAEAEFDSLGCNVLAIAPRVCLMFDGNDETRRRLESAGADVRVIPAKEIGRKGCGGPTCLTRPIAREI